MKILRIIYDWPPPWQGLAPHPYEITVFQTKLGHEVSIFCGRWPKAGAIIEPKGCKVYPIIREPFKGAIFFTSSIILFFKYLFWRKSHKTDIIHCHGHFAVWIYVYRAFLQKHFPWVKELKTPLIVHFHNVAKSRWVSFEEKKKPISPISKYFVWPMCVFSDKMAIKTAAACIFVSRKNKEDAIKYYKADPKRCFIVETGVNSDLFIPTNQVEREKSRKELGLDRFDQVLLNHGVMSERKNIDLLIKTLALLPDPYKLILAGTGSDNYMEKLSDLMDKHNIKDRVILMGYIPYPEAPIAYQISDVFILPSEWEGLPKAVMQGLSCGVPCVVSGFKLSREIQGLYYLEDTKPKLIAEKIKEIIDNKPIVDIDKVKNYYSWDSRVKEIEKIYVFAQKNYLL